MILVIIICWGFGVVFVAPRIFEQASIYIDRFFQKDIVKYQYTDDGHVLVFDGYGWKPLKIEGFYVYRDPDAGIVQKPGIGTHNIMTGSPTVSMGTHNVIIGFHSTESMQGWTPQNVIIGFHPTESMQGWTP